MFGCGQFSEKDMLLYLDAHSKEKDKIEAHLKGCSTCLKEITELNRINARTAAVMPEPLKKPFFLSLLVRNGSIERALSAAGKSRLAALEPTRKNDINDKNKARYSIDSIPADIEIMPAQDNKCWISLMSPNLKDSMVQIMKKGDELPVYSKKADSSQVLFKGIEPGEYEISLRNYTIQIVIRND